MKLRNAVQDDCRLLFEWANDSEVRQMSFSKDPIPWQNHVDWFSRKLASNDCCIYIAFDDENVPVGQIRFDKTNEGEAEIGISLAPDQRKKGYGTQLIVEGTRKYFLEHAVARIHAIVQKFNPPSMRAFEKAGFSLLAEEIIHDSECNHYIIDRCSLNKE